MIVLNSLVVGLGQIGMTYDYDVENDSKILTHTSGFHYHSGYKLEGAVDPNKDACIKFTKKFYLPSYNSLKEASKFLCPDVVSIATPSASHYATFLEVLEFFTPKAILIEKPIALKISEAREIVKIARNKNCVIAVNYILRFEPGVRQLKKMIEQDEFGRIYKGCVWYSKGIINNGSHYVDLLSCIFGNVGNIKILEKGRKWDARDPEPDVSMRFGNVDIIFLAGKEEYFEISELELIGTKGRIQIHQGGLSISYQKVINDPIFSGYSILNSKKSEIATDIMRYQFNVLDNLHQHIRNQGPLYSTGDSGLMTLEIIDEIIKLSGE
jgi:predicted dehydrogenase